MRLTNTKSTDSAVLQHSSRATLYDVAVQKIVEELNCSTARASAGMAFIQHMLEQARTGARCSTVGVHHLTTEEMSMTGYSVMDEVMAHGATAQDGTAHAAIERALLGPNEYAFIHDNPNGLPEDCVVMITVMSA